MRRPRHDSGRPVRRAFTLIELIATIVVLGVVSAAASGIVLTAVDGYTDASTTAQLHTELSIALDRITRELRNIPLDDAAAGIAPDIGSVSSSTIQWESDSAVSRIGTNLMIQVDAGAPATIASDVTDFTVAIYDESGAAIAMPASFTACDPIRRIELTVTATRNGATETLRTRIFLRSTMTGASTS